MKITINKITMEQKDLSKIVEYNGVLEDKYEFYARISLGLMDEIELLLVDAEDYIVFPVKQQLEKYLETYSFLVPEMGEMEF